MFKFITSQSFNFKNKYNLLFSQINNLIYYFEVNTNDTAN